MPMFSAADPLMAVNVPGVSPADDAFVLLETQTPLHWVRLTGLPVYAHEKIGPLEKTARYRAALQAALAAKPGRSIVISHLPLMSGAVSAALSLLGRRAPHLAFAFNFTALPTGKRLAYLRYTLSRVAQFSVFSAHERDLYADYFDFDPALFRPVMWTQDAPAVQAEPGLPPGAPYVCAVGGEGRDFGLIMAVARRMPALRFVVIARPHSLIGIDVPDNVDVLTNIPLERVWRIASDSLGVLVPLLSRDTNCGVVTLVSAKLLGLPQATTYSYATREYVEGREAVLLCEPNDPVAFAKLIEQMVDEAPALRAAAERAKPQELELHHRRHWADHVDAFIAAQRIAG